MLNKFSSIASFAVLTATILTIAVPASAEIIFDSQVSGEQSCNTGFCYNETRGSGQNYAAVLKFNNDVTVSRIGVYSSVDDAQDVKFLIFDSGFNGGTGNLLFSQVKSFGVTSQRFLYTDAMRFTFLAGKTYDIGILGDGGSLTGRWATGDTTQNGITGIARNANFYNYDSPGTGGYSGVVPYIQLEGVLNAVPEPATWALMIAGFGLVGGAMRPRAPHANAAAPFSS